MAALVAAGAGAGVGPGVGRRGSLLVSGCAALRDPRAEQIYSVLNIFAGSNPGALLVKPASDKLKRQLTYFVIMVHSRFLNNH